MVNYFNSHWELRPLGECLEFISRGVAPKYVSKSDIAALNQKAIRWGFIEEKHLKYHDSNKKIKDDLFIRKGDIVVNSTGDITIGRAYYFKKGWPRIFADSHVTILRLNRNILLPEFCIYLFPTQEYQTKIYGLVTGTTGQLELSKNNLCKLEMIVPPLPIQQKIAAILSAYDDLIEKNLRRIKILEEMAQSLYREWFVKFRFPGHQKVKMVNSPLGKIPEGWEIKKLSELTEVIDCLHSKKPKEADDKDRFGILLHIWNIPGGGQLDLSKKFYINRSDYEMWTKRIEVQEGDCVITNVGRIGDFAQIPRGVKAAIGRNMTAVRSIPGKLTPTYLVEYLRSPHMDKERIAKKDSGTIMDSLNVKGIVQLLVPVPNNELMNDFEKISRPMRLRLEILRQQNDILRQTRDLLLPKLISGELDVSELDISIPEANA